MTNEPGTIPESPRGMCVVRFREGSMRAKVSWRPPVSEDITATVIFSAGTAIATVPAVVTEWVDMRTLGPYSTAFVDKYGMPSVLTSEET